MNKLFYISAIGLLVATGCKKDAVNDPIDIAPIEDPIEKAPLIPIGKIIGQSTITNAAYIDGLHFCPDAEIEIGVTTDLSVDKIIYYGLYISGVTGDTTVMWSTEVQGHESILVGAYDALEAVIVADVFALEGNDRTPGVKPLGYDFPPPLIAHQEHPVICAENGYTTTLSNGFPGAAKIKWTKDYHEIPNETSADLVVTSPGVYDIKISYAECPDFFQGAGGVEVVEALSVKPSVIVNGTTVAVSNYAQMQFATLELVDAANNVEMYNGFTDQFDNVTPGTYTVRASFWGSEFYMGLGDIGRVSVCSASSDVIIVN